MGQKVKSITKVSVRVTSSQRKEQQRDQYRRDFGRIRGSTYAGPKRI